MRIKIKDSGSPIPMQQSNDASKLKVASNYYLQKFLKFNQIGIFHSYPELLHAALLESDPEVISFVPQPFKYLVNGKRYIPDCYVAYKNKRLIIELKPKGKFVEDKKIALESFLKIKYGFDFVVRSDESVLEQEFKAKNWLLIIRTLINASNYKSDNQELEVLEKFKSSPEMYIGDVIDIGNRIQKDLYEIALFRLIHQGKLSISNKEYLDLNTEVSLCI